MNSIKLKLWQVKGKTYYFPAHWSKKKILQWLNLDIKVCPICGKVDAGNNHFDKCDPTDAVVRELNNDNYYK